MMQRVLERGEHILVRKHILIRKHILGEFMMMQRVLGEKEGKKGAINGTSQHCNKRSLHMGFSERNKVTINGTFHNYTRSL